MDPVIKYQKYRVLDADCAEGDICNEGRFIVYPEPVRIEYNQSSKKLFIIISLSIMNERKQQPMQIVRYTTEFYYLINHRNNKINISRIEKCAKGFGVIYSFEALVQLINKQAKTGMNKAFRIAPEELRELVETAKVSFVVVK